MMREKCGKDSSDFQPHNKSEELLTVSSSIEFEYFALLALYKLIQESNSGVFLAVEVN